MGPNLQSYRSKRHNLLLSCDESLRAKKPKREDAGADVSTRVKDLRSRRIFSPASISGGNGGVGGELGFQIDDHKGVSSVDFGSFSNGENELIPNLKDLKGESVVGLDPHQNTTDDKEDSASENKLVVKSSSRRKVLKVHGSNTYRRLLPFLMNMAKDDTCSFSVSPCISKAEKNGLGPQNSNRAALELIAVMENNSLSKHEDISAHPDSLKLLESDEIKNYGISRLSCEAQVLEALKLSNTEGHTRLHGVQKGSENGKISNGAEETIEVHVISKTDEINLGVSSNVQNSNGSKSTHSAMDLKGEDGGANDLEPPENGDIMSHLSSEALHTDQLNLSDTEEGILDNKYHKCNDNGGSSRGLDAYAEEHIEATPPDISIISTLELNITENEEKLKREIAIENNSFTHESKCKEDICLKNSPNFKRKTVLTSCSRGKIVKTPGSFSYRRLLPYLMDVSNDKTHNSLDASKVPSHQEVKNNSVEEKPNMDSPMVDSLNCQETPIRKSEASFSTDHLEACLDIGPLTAIPSNADNKQTLTSGVESIELQKPVDYEKECTLPVEQVTFNIIKSLEHVSCGESSKTETACPAIPSFSSGDNRAMPRDDTRKSSNSGQAPKALHSVCLDQKSSLIEESFSFENQINVSKGILKRNPRGCRGLCNCLNCTSFRLHADRAFEFSRNQLLDTEELALNLIKELSGLRNMLKESTISSNGQITANVDQVMVACSKALKAEESAKCRLQEMHLDLRVHCRSKLLERPKVKFANHVSEMVIPEVTEKPEE